MAVAILLLTEFSILTGDDEAAAVSGGTAAFGDLDPIEEAALLFQRAEGFVAEAAASEIAPSALEPEENAPRGEERYVVVAGDTLAAISRRFETSVAAIVAYNGIANPDALRVGQELRIPPEGYEPPPVEPDPAEPDPAETDTATAG